MCISNLCKNCTGWVLVILNYCQLLWAEPCMYLCSTSRPRVLHVNNLKIFMHNLSLLIPTISVEISMVCIFLVQGIDQDFYD